MSTFTAFVSLQPFPAASVSHLSNSATCIRLPLPARIQQRRRYSVISSLSPIEHGASDFDFVPVVNLTSSSMLPEEDSGAQNWTEQPAYDGGAVRPPTSGSGSGPGDSDDGATPPASDEPLTALLRDSKAAISDIPADILAAYRGGLIPVSAISNYFSARANILSRLLMGAGSGMRNRFLADKLFLLKILIEEGIGIFGKLSAEYEQRRKNFWKEKEFVFANLITALLADFALVYLPAPSVSLTKASTEKGIKAWIANLSRTLPSNIFQTDRPFTLAQRAGGFALKASQLFVVGMACCFTGVILTNSLVFIRERLDKGYVPKTQKQNPLLVSVLYAIFLGASSGTRYQLVNGVENHVFPRVFSKTPQLLEEAATFLLRYVNTFWGSQQWVMFCRFTNVQKTKE
ncbi:Protein RETICULATA-RELATED 4, chloroplastic [Gracilariopsis chorda]|uniref:Protein RETICULATA-RELATED 4, chloroplastic n=1 Tax=Gracilariopsis chorda TaxID=448386 RepID=A0A2V3IHJ0_9FLOR|nr:Protein RETICULATA-RELATED 4, chloroplastic [Gracilariopsis chorda]|eukprot:PXF41532.1 Protein RETICULATA-RELATED 4, chloroplastic [Gracilariopsis chorda]